eukprot:GHVT01030439.1.p1 GENE.GHVT01030439.1~~GHVT01030439.1.p1  ORF type:complete len:307 (+),score=74.78 GHVT01030439.1:483-1403(+)
MISSCSPVPGVLEDGAATDLFCTPASSAEAMGDFVGAPSFLRLSSSTTSSWSGAFATPSESHGGYAATDAPGVREAEEVATARVFPRRPIGANVAAGCRAACSSSRCCCCPEEPCASADRLPNACGCVDIRCSAAVLSAPCAAAANGGASVVVSSKEYVRLPCASLLRGATGRPFGHRVLRLLPPKIAGLNYDAYRTVHEHATERGHVDALRAVMQDGELRIDGRGTCGPQRSVTLPAWAGPACVEEGVRVQDRWMASAIFGAAPPAIVMGDIYGVWHINHLHPNTWKSHPILKWFEWDTLLLPTG